MRKPFLPSLDIPRLYAEFDAPVTPFDCGQKCAPHNPHGIPFCCDICHAVPVAYQQEWSHLEPVTDLWHLWRGDECADDPTDPVTLKNDVPDSMLLLACQGPAHCQRPQRALSCRQFPFYPYITSDDRFIGMAYEWDFEDTCWVISNLGEVTGAYRDEFMRTYRALFQVWEQEFENYANLSDEMRQTYAAKKRRIPLLHRNGGYYLVSPSSERLTRVAAAQLPKFGHYRTAPAQPK